MTIGNLFRKGAELADQASARMRAAKDSATKHATETWQDAGQALNSARQKIKGDDAAVYDSALIDVAEYANMPQYAGKGLTELLADLKADNPYR